MECVSGVHCLPPQGRRKGALGHRVYYTVYIFFIYISISMRSSSQQACWLEGSHLAVVTGVSVRVVFGEGGISILHSITILFFGSTVVSTSIDAVHPQSHSLRA